MFHFVIFWFAQRDVKDQLNSP